MAKKQDLENKENKVPDLSAEEVVILRKRIEELEQREKSRDEFERNRIPAVNHLAEMQQLRKNGKDDSSSIKYKDIHDHRNIRLWHTNGREVGRPLGPIHPANAEQTFQAFYAKGIILSIQRPTQEHIDRYKQTDEYKALMKVEERRREGKKSMSKENSVDKLTAAVAKLAGIPIENTLMPNAVTASARR